MFNMGMTELLLIGAIALIVIGPKRMPDVARKFGKLLREIKKTTNGFKSNLSEEFNKQVGPEAVDLANMAKDLRGGIKTPMDIAEALDKAAGVLEKSGELPKVDPKSDSVSQPASKQATVEAPEATPPAYAEVEEPAQAPPTRAPGHKAPVLQPPEGSNPT